MRDVNEGWLIRYVHANGASFFFACMYIHIGKAIYYGSYRKPRVLLWVIGVIIFVLTMATAFMGYNNSPKLYCYIIILVIYIYLQFIIRDLTREKQSVLEIRNYKNHTENYKHNKFINKKGYRYMSTKVTKEISTDETNIKVLFKEIHPLGVEPIIYFDNVHLNETKTQILNTVRDLAGIYIIINKITKNYYIGSASTNRFYSRFTNHLIYGRGSKLINKSVNKYGLNNFILGILMIYPTLINKENNKELLYIETEYLQKYTPPYNILTEAGNSFGYKHSELTKLNMKLNYTEERKNILRQFQYNLKNNWPEERKQKLRDIANNRSNNYLTPEGRNKISDVNSITIELLTSMESFNEDSIKDMLNKDNNQLTNSHNSIKYEYILVCTFKNIKTAAHYLCCSFKTIQRAINIGYINIPNEFNKYLNNNHIDNNNSIIEFISTPSGFPPAMRGGTPVSNRKKRYKSSLVFTNDKTKYYIKQSPGAHRYAVGPGGGGLVK